jgi:hypothetical protein
LPSGLRKKKNLTTKTQSSQRAQRRIFKEKEERILTGYQDGEDEDEEKNDRAANQLYQIILIQ